MSEMTGIEAKYAILRERARAAFANALAPLANWLAKSGMSAVELTWGGFGLAILAGLLAGFRVFTIAGIVYLIAGVADLLDGALARRTNAASGRGAFLDSFLDRAGEGVIHAGAAVAFAYWAQWAGVLAVALSLTGGYLTSYARARAEGLGIELPEVWFGRGERLVLLSLGLIFYFAFVAFWILAVLGWLSAAHRCHLAFGRLPGPPIPEPASTDDNSDEEATGV